MFCKNCGKILGTDDKFCAECGTKVVVEKKKPVELEPMFFVERREEPAVEKKAKRVVHLDEFNWDLDGYPTAPRKTEAVDFDWASVLEEKVKKAAPKPVEPKEKKPEPLDEMPKTIEELLAALPSGVLEAVAELEDVPATEAEEEEATETETVEAEEGENLQADMAEAPAETEAKVEEVKTLEQIIEDFGEGPIEEPTRLIDKAQMKTESVDRFYVFSKRQEEYQNLLDQEYDRIQNSLNEKAEEEPANLTIEEILGTVAEPVEETAEAPVEEAKAEPVTEPVEEVSESIQEEPAEEAPVEEIQEEPAEEEKTVAVPVAESKPLELVAIMWAMPPAGILIEKEEKQMEAPVETIEDVEPEEPVETTVSTDTIVIQKEEIVKEEPKAEAKPAEEEPAEASGGKETISFADIFDDDEDDKKDGKGGGCLKFIAIVLIILIALELGILGVQYFAPDSSAAKLINQTYGKIVSMITGAEEPASAPAETEETAGPSEIETLIEAQASKNENIESVLENPELVFDADEDYGYEELSDTYTFINSPWYETEDGKEVTYGDEIIGVLIQYYSALPDKINDVNKDVLDYVDDTTALYEELDAIEGDETRGYSVNCLEIGEIKTGQKGFYVMVKVTSADKLQPEQTQQKQLVYLEANPNLNDIKINETKNI